MKNKRFVLKWIIILAAACFLADGLIYYYVSKQGKAILNATLKHYSDISLAAINPDRVESVSNSLTDKGADFDRLRTQLLKLEELFSMDGIDSIYTMKLSGNDILFLVDSTPLNSPDYGPPGEKYIEPPKEIYSVMSSGQPEYVGPYIDEYGEFYSYFTPIRRFSDGVIVGSIGLDIRSSFYSQILRNKLPYYFSIVLFIYIFSIIILFFIERILRSRNELNLQRRISGNLMNVLPDIFYLIGKDGKLVLVNKAFIDRVNIKPDIEISQIDFYSLFVGQNKVKITKSVESAYGSGGNFIEAELVLRDGQTVVFEFYHAIFKDENGEIIGVAGRGHDISIRHQQVIDLAIQKDKLEKVNNIMIGRELKMVELKEENSKLKTLLEQKK